MPAAKAVPDALVVEIHALVDVVVHVRHRVTDALDVAVRARIHVVGVVGVVDAVGAENLVRQNVVRHVVVTVKDVPAHVEDVQVVQVVADVKVVELHVLIIADLDVLLLVEVVRALVLADVLSNVLVAILDAMAVVKVNVKDVPDVRELAEVHARVAADVPVRATMHALRDV